MIVHLYENMMEWKCERRARSKELPVCRRRRDCCGGRPTRGRWIRHCWWSTVVVDKEGRSMWGRKQGFYLSDGYEDQLATKELEAAMIEQFGTGRGLKGWGGELCVFLGSVKGLMGKMVNFHIPRWKDFKILPHTEGFEIPSFKGKQSLLQIPVPIFKHNKI